LRRDCGGDIGPYFAKEISRKVPTDLVEELARLLPEERARRRLGVQHDGTGRTSPRPASPKPSLAFESPQSTQSGPNAVVEPRLLVGELRELVRRASLSVTVRVVVTASPPRRAGPTYLATSAAQRQRRRRTWDDRAIRNGLPDDANVTITFRGLQSAFEPILGSAAIAT